MATLAPVFGATVGERALRKRPWGEAAVAPAACGEMPRENNLARSKPSAPPSPKRACRGLDVEISAGPAVVAASAPGRLKQRMEAERDALSSLLKKAVILSRDAGRSGVVAPAGTDANRQPPVKKQSTEPKKQLPAAPRMDVGRSGGVAPAGKDAKGQQPEATKHSTEPKQQPLTVQRAAPRTAKSSMVTKIDKAKEAREKLRLERIALERERFRRELLEVEKAAMPDETIYPEDLEELGITATSQYDVTRTWKQVQRLRGGGRLHVGGA